MNSRIVVSMVPISFTVLPFHSLKAHSMDTLCRVGVKFAYNVVSINQYLLYSVQWYPSALIFVHLCGLWCTLG